MQNDLNWFNTQMVQVATHKSMAQLLVAEGLVHLENGRTNEAARCFTDCIVFAHAAHRRGLIIDELVGIACQAIGSRQLVPVAPDVSPEVLREILRELIALDQVREPAAAIVQRDRECITTNSFLLYSAGPDAQDDGGTPLQRGEMETGDLLPTAL